MSGQGHAFHCIASARLLRTLCKHLESAKTNSCISESEMVYQSKIYIYCSVSLLTA